MDWQVLGICIVIGILLTVVGELFTEDNFLQVYWAQFLHQSKHNHRKGLRE